MQRLAGLLDSDGKGRGYARSIQGLSAEPGESRYDVGFAFHCVRTSFITVKDVAITEVQMKRSYRSFAIITTQLKRQFSRK